MVYLFLNNPVDKIRINITKIFGNMEIEISVCDPFSFQAKVFVNKKITGCELKRQITQQTGREMSNSRIIYNKIPIQDNEIILVDQSQPYIILENYCSKTFFPNNFNLNLNSDIDFPIKPKFHSFFIKEKELNSYGFILGLDPDRRLTRFEIINHFRRLFANSRESRDILHHIRFLQNFLHLRPIETPDNMEMDIHSDSEIRPLRFFSPPRQQSSDDNSDDNENENVNANNNENENNRLLEYFSEDERQAIIRISSDLQRFDLGTIAQVFHACGRSEETALQCLRSM